MTLQWNEELQPFLTLPIGFENVSQLNSLFFDPKLDT
jgi:hypothetical protein